MLAVNNFFAVLAALTAVHIFLGKGVRAYRILTAALLGAFGSCLIFALSRNMAACLLLEHFILNPLILCYCFREKNRKEFFTDLCAGYFAFLIVGGMIEWMYAGGNGFFGYEASAAAAVFVLLFAAVWARQKRKREIRYLKAGVRQGEKNISLQALSDSGNLLRDPYTGKSVSMIDRQVFDSAFGPPQSVRIIPYESLGCKHGLLEVVTIEKLSYAYEDGERSVPQAVLGLADHALFENKLYQMIINPEENPTGGRYEKDR